jgi:hypothetical protein
MDNLSGVEGLMPEKGEVSCGLDDWPALVKDPKLVQPTDPYLIKPREFKGPLAMLILRKSHVTKFWLRGMHVWVVKKDVVRILEFERDPEGINHFIMFENTHPEVEMPQMPKIRRSRAVIEKELEQAREALAKAEDKAEETNSLNRGDDFSIPEDMGACFAACTARDKVIALEAELAEHESL